MKEKIFTFLKTKIGSHAGGIQDNYLMGIAETYSKTITEEAQIVTIITDGLLELLKNTYSSMQPEIDRRAEAKTKAELKAFQDKHGLNEDGTLIKPAKTPKVKDTDPEEPPWFTTWKTDQQKVIDDLNNKMTQHEQEKTSDALVGKVKAHDKLKDIPASYLKGRNLVPKSEADIDQLVTSIETDYNGFKQEMAEKGVVISVPPTGGGQQGEKVTINEYLDEKFPKEPKGKNLIKT